MYSNLESGAPRQGADRNAGTADADAAARPTNSSFPSLIAPTQGVLPELLAAANRYAPLRMAVVHPCDAQSLAGVQKAVEAGYIEPWLVGPREKIVNAAAAAGFDLHDVTIDAVEHSHAAAARAVQLAASGHVEALMKGSLHTDELMSAVVADASRLRTERRLSHCYLMQTPAYGRPFIITDAAINIAPTLDEKADIVRNAVDLAHLLGVTEPRVAVLCAVETVNSRMQSTLDAAALCKMAQRGQIVGALIDGPLAFDNAVSANAARIKGIASPVAGCADVFIVPDLEAGNMLAKQFEFLGGAASAGIVMGARVPIVLTSRADSLATRVASCALAVLVRRVGVLS
jgi:phosphate acetyltransferase